MQEWYVVVETILHLISDADLSPPQQDDHITSTFALVFAGC